MSGRFRRRRSGAAFAWMLVALGLAGPGCGALTSAVMQEVQDVDPLALVKGGARAAAASLPIGLDEELAYGGAVAVMIVDRYGGLYEGATTARYVDLVGQAVASVSERPELTWHFGVLMSDEVQALSAPGGYVFVTRGALRQVKSEAELAGVLAHEVAHVSARHALDIIRAVKAQSELLRGAGEAWRSPQAFTGVVDAFLQNYLETGLPQPTEHAADAMGTTYAGRIGYDPRGLREFLAGLRAGPAQGAAAGPAFLRTHPDLAERVVRLDAMLGNVQGGATLPERLAGHLRLDEQVVPGLPQPATEPAPDLPPVATPLPEPATATTARP